VGLRALPNLEPVDFDVRDAYDSRLFWAPVEPEVDGAVLIQADQFYLFSSLERVALPADHAAIMVPRNSIIGEFLFHYAGFFDPGYGTPRGAPFGLAIRSRWSSFYLNQEQMVARLIYEPLLEPSQRTYGSEVNSSYDTRPFPMAKQFRTTSLFG
jgi:dCTP deaminase